MAKRNLPTALESALVNNEPFDYAHLIKFERPFNPFEGEFRENENRFVYLTDGARDVEFKGDTYNAHQLLTVGNYSETTQARATSMSITVPGEYLGLSVTLAGTLSANNSARTLEGTCTFTATDAVVDGLPFSWSEKGFKIGDKISLKKQNGTLFSGGTDAASIAREAVSEKIFIISGISDSQLTLKQTGIEEDDSSFLISALSSTFVVGLLNEEIFGATLDKGTRATVLSDISDTKTITLTAANSKIRLGQLISGTGIDIDTMVTSISGTTLKLNKTQSFISSGTELIFTNPSFVNRKVEVYKAFLNPDTGAIIGEAILTFKGFITSTDIQETPTSSKVKWNMTSHWGDFSEISGRMTSDEIHRALDSNGRPQKLLAVKPQYATDLGFLHGDMSLNTIATYQTSETRFRNKKKRRGGIAGFFGDTKTYVEEYQEEVDHDVDLSVYLQGKHLPVVYGVMRVPGVPVFADTLKNDPNSIYVAYALSEGEIQGIYNLYIDSNSLLCVDAQDATARSGGSENTALTCFGRMDRGGTLGGTNIGSSGTLSFEDWLDVEGLSADYDEAYNDGREEDIEAMYDDYVAINEADIGTVNPTDSLLGLGHEDSASISSPHDIDFTFHSGRPFQKTNNILATVAAGDNFKRQDDYYTGLERYWSPDHTLLDTAYAVVKFQIDADSTTIPEIEYVVKGKALQCFNYDGTFVSDPVYQAATQSAYGGEADSDANFKEGDIVSVETSYNGVDWQTETGFRILHKYTDITTRGQAQIRFILDKQPNLNAGGVSSIEITNPGTGYTSTPTISFSGGSGSGASASVKVKQVRGRLGGFFNIKTSARDLEQGKVKSLTIDNPGKGYLSAPTVTISGGGGSGATAVAKIDAYEGVPQRKFVRLKSSANKYWHMLTYNSNVQDTPLNILNSNKIDITDASTDSNGILTLTLTSAAKTRFLQLYPNTTATSSSSQAHIKIGGTLPSALKSVKDKTMRVHGLSGGSTGLSISNFRFTPNQTNLHTNIEVMPSDAFFINSTHEYRGSPLATLTSNELVGSFFQVIETDEVREITSVDVANNIVRLEAPLMFTPNITGTTNNNDTYVIQGKGLDKRVSINPAIQTTDLLINDRYGKGLDIEEDIDIGSVREAALLCDSRADVTVSLASAGNVTAGDIYKLTYSGNHVASGEVLTTASNTTSVTFTNVSGKFLRPFAQHIKYKPGDIILVQGASTNTPYYYQYTGSGGYETTQPSHTSGTTGSWTVITSISLTKVSGSGSSTLAMNVSGNGVSYSLYDGDFVKYWRYIGWVNSEQFNVTRHQTNFYFDTSKPLFDNVNAILSHYNGILSYSNGKYVLSVETAEATPTASITNGIQTNPEYIDESDIIGNISLNDNSLRTAKNTVKASLNDPQNHFNSRSVSFFNSDFLKADRGIVKTGSFPFTGITSYYNARINVEKELIQSRYSKEITFMVGPKGLLLKPGEVISLTYAPFNFENKLFRIENLTYNANCNTSIKAREYDDSIYAITEQRATLAHKAVTGLGQEFAVPSKPTSVSASTNKPGIVTLNWTNGTGFKEATDSTEIWRRATTNNRSGATLVAVVDNATTFNDALGTAGTFYYWLRHRRNAKSTASQAIRVVHSEFHAGDTAGAQALALVPSPQLDVDVSSAQIRFNASNALTPTGTAQDVPLTATLRNITASSVTFTLKNSNTTTTASDVTFTNGSATQVVNSAPFTATIDASSFAHDTENKFVKVTCTDSNSNETFSELIPVTVSKDGSSGSIGVDAKAIKLIPSSHVVSYSAVGGESTTITFTTETQGFTGTKFYQFLVGGSVKQASTTSTFTLADSDEPAANATTNVVVKLYDTDASGTLLAQDTVTIFGVKDGSDGVTAFLTNNSHVVSTAADGTGANFTNAGGQFKVFVGSTEITTATSGGQKVTFSVVSATGVTVGNSAQTAFTDNGNYTISAMSADQGTVVFRASIPANLSPDGSAFTIDQTYSISKSKTGLQGAAGSDAKTVQLSSNEYAINYDENGSLVAGQGTGSSGSEILTLSADAKNFSSAEYQYTENGTQIQAFTTSSTETVSIPQSAFTTPKIYQVNVKEAGGSVEASDSLAVFAVREGTDAHTVFLTNPTHAFPAATDGTVAGSDLDAGDTEFRVFRGNQQLTFNASGGGAGTNTYNVGASPTLSNMTGTFSTVSNQRKFEVAGVTADSGSATFTITAGGNTFTQTYTYSKSKKGTEGDDGQNTAEVKIYKRSDSDSAPAVPDGNVTYTFADGTVTNNADLDGWTLSPPTTGGDFLYFCVATATSTGTTDVIATGDWSTPIRQTIEIPRKVFDTIYYSAYTSGDPQELTNSQLAALKYDFSARNFASSTLPSGWSNTRPAGFSSYSYAIIKVIETNFEGNSETAGNQTKTVEQYGIFGDFLKFERDALVIDFDSTTGLKYRFDSGDSFTTVGTTPAGLKNASITTNADGTLTGAGGGTAPTVDGITGVTDFQSRVTTGLTSSGILDTTVPVGKGGTGQTNTNKFLNSDLGLSFTETGVTLTKAGDTDSSANTPNALKNSQISLTASGGTVTLNNANTTNNTITKASIALGNVLNAEQVRKDLANAPDAIKNDEISIASDGTLSGAGGGQVTVAGIGAITPTDAQAKVDNRLSSTEKTRLNAGKSPDNARSFDNADVDATHVGLGNVTNESKATMFASPTFTGTVGGVSSSMVGLGNVTNDPQVKANLSNLNIASADLEVSGGQLQAKAALKNSQIQLSASGGTVSLVNASGSNNSFDQSSIGLGNVQNKSSATIRSEIVATDIEGSGKAFPANSVAKLGGIEAGATVGAKLDDNLVDENNNDLASSDIVTNQGTSSDTSNVNSVASTNVTPAITAAQNNAASIIQGLANGTQQVTANAITTGSIATSLLTLSELLLETQGTTQTGTTLSFGNYSQSHNLGTMGTGAGFYVGMVHFDAISGNSIREGSIHIDIKAGASTVYTDYMGYAFTESNGTYNQDNHYSTSERKLHMQFGFFYTGTGTLTMNIIARSNGSSGTSARVGFRSVKFGAEVVGLSGSIGNISSATAGAADQESGAITVSGFTGSKTITLSGHSSGEVEVNNSGTFASSASITSGQTFKLRLDASSTAGTTRSVTATLGTASITFSVTTAGSYSSGFGSGGSGGSGSGGGGFQNTIELQ